MIKRLKGIRKWSGSRRVTVMCPQELRYRIARLGREGRRTADAPVTAPEGGDEGIGRVVGFPS
ncbi:hypothetical protein GCM10018771_66920 [Streptomyces cellulosae]|nr:hypothetical protein GCM10018771_66920 [Streptomyces cellulosae]